jgi:type II secretory pathway pseudopilin PulG
MRNRLKGVTLLETLVYLGLFGIIIIVMLSFMLSTQESTLRTQRKSSLLQSSELFIQHLNHSMKRSQGINEVESVFEDNQGKLVLLFETGNKEYRIENSKLYYDSVLLTAPNILVNHFFLEPIYNNSGVIIGIKTDILLISSSDSNLSEPINMLFTFR